MTKRSLTVGLLLLTTPALAQDGFRHGRFRWVEGGVTVQRATDTGAEEAVVNLPFLPGDRVWTDASGRAEFQFVDGSLLRLDGGSKLDYVAHEGGSRDRTVLRLWSGGAYLHTREVRSAPDFGIETPSGVIEATERGVYRIDVASGETRLSVYEGEAALEADGTTRVRAGERVYARAGEPVEGPERFDRAAVDDEFARWDAERGEAPAYASRSPYLSNEVSPYGPELDTYGQWHNEPEVGYVWTPYVGPEWYPYYNGRWVWTAFGWTWVGNEPWGWAPYHYGRWGYRSVLGWYWIPGRVWGPAWVSWAVGPSHVGWCALGRYDRPVVVRNNGFLRGYAVPRGSVVETSPWTYARRVDLSAHDLARRIADARDVGHEVRPLEGPHARLGRDLTAAVDRTAAVVERTAVAGDRVAVPRTDRETAPHRVRTRPTPGDTVPELRSDPMTTIPFPVARRRPRDNQEPAAAEPNDPAQARTPTRWRRTESAIAAAPVVAPPAAAHPTDVRTPSRASEGTQPIRRAEPRPAGEGDRQVLRPLFRALAHPRSDEAERPQPRAEDGARTRPHAEPRAEDGERARPHAQPRAEDSERPRPRRPEAEGERGGAARPRAEGERAERSGRREGPPPATAQPSSDGGRPHAGHRRKEGSE